MEFSKRQHLLIDDYPVMCQKVLESTIDRKLSCQDILIGVTVPWIAIILYTSTYLKGDSPEFLYFGPVSPMFSVSSTYYN